MRTLWTILCLTLTCAFASGQTVVATELEQGFILVDVKVDSGRVGKFIVAIEQPTSSVSRGWLADSSGENHALEIGGLKLGSFRLTPASGLKAGSQTLAGVLGSDVLGRFAVGYDKLRYELCLWDKSLSKADAAKWVGTEGSFVPMLKRGGVWGISSPALKDRFFVVGLTM